MVIVLMNETAPVYSPVNLRTGLFQAHKSVTAGCSVVTILFIVAMVVEKNYFRGRSKRYQLDHKGISGYPKFPKHYQ